MKNAYPTLFTAIRESCTAALWSNAVELTRGAEFLLESEGPESIVVKVTSPATPASPRVTLWPDDETWSCTCSSVDDPCLHVAAGIIALRNQQTKQDQTEKLENTVLVYRFYRAGSSLALKRYIRDHGNDTLLSSSLTAYVGGVRTGRILGKPLSVTQEDFSIDDLLGTIQGPLPSSDLAVLFGSLLHTPAIEYENSPISVSTEPVLVGATVEQVSSGYQLKQTLSANVLERFSNGAALCVCADPTSAIPASVELRCVTEVQLSAEQRALLTSGTVYSPAELPNLLHDIVPKLQEKIPVNIPPEHLRTYLEIEPRIELKVESIDDGTSMLVTPRLYYGSPPLAEVTINEFLLTNPEAESIPRRNLPQEATLARRLARELQLELGKSSVFAGVEAVLALKRFENWSVSGGARSLFTPVSTPLPVAAVNNDQATLSVGDIDFREIVQRWKDGEVFFKSVDGRWIEVPTTWLSRYAAAAQHLLSLQESPNRAVRLVALADFCESAEIPSPLAAQELRNRLTSASTSGEAVLPADLTATLRPYQLAGVAWLQYLQALGLGALLADDMGLGKTVQTLSVIEHDAPLPSLIIAPTSVIYSWAEQLAQFRPGLKFCLYHGSKRAFDSHAHVLITSYGTLRSEPERFVPQRWQTIVVDEAQFFKNPDSQTAQLIHQLQGTHRIALTGTPIENSAQDLWSIFHFTNPGLLGTRREFADQYLSRSTDTDSTSIAQLSRRVKPLLLRRLKREVAPDLPERTSVTLRCELSEEETNIYRTILAATKQEVLSKFEAGASVLSILECLLRLRQCCCYPALVPGVSHQGSAKLTLLLDSLREGISMGHRSLVFSQWTSMLDVIQAELEQSCIPFLRLDGQSTDRQNIVAQFQSPDGPPVFLLSLKAGGSGLTLTAADHVYLVDPWWNPAVEAQAADRAHRIGQRNPVLIRRLIACETVEEKIIQLQERKQELADAITEGKDSGSLAITKEDLLDLLEIAQP